MLPAIATDFTPVASLIGGVLVGLSAVMVMAGFGRIAGIAGITLGAAASDDRVWRLAFIGGLLAAPVVWVLVLAEVPQQTVSSRTGAMVIAGLLVGLGTAIGSGCTSGHGVCGLARLSRRSLAAVATFMGFAGVTVFILRHVVGGGV
ncbi:MAG: YeeE/YedE family protein [Jannaschia sp.]